MTNTDIAMRVFQRVIDCRDRFTIGIAGEGEGSAGAPALEGRLAGSGEAADVGITGGVCGTRKALYLLVRFRGVLRVEGGSLRMLLEGFGEAWLLPIGLER